MTAPVRPEADRLSAFRTTLENIKRLGREQGLPQDVIDEAVARVTQDEQTTPEMQETTRDEVSMSYPQRFAATVANVTQGIPGVEMAQAGARALVRRQPYGEALGDIRASTAEIPHRTVQRLPGAVASAVALPVKNPVAAGAIFGAAQEGLEADLQSPMKRLLQTLKGGAVGAATGKVTDVGSTAVRALGRPGNAAKDLFRMQAERAKVAGSFYDAARRQGKVAEATPLLRQFLDEPDIREIRESLKATREFADLADDSPEWLDPLYKVLSDQGKTVGKALGQLNPSKINIGRFEQRNIGAAKRQALQAADEVMPDYREAVEEFAKRTADMEALKQGYNAVKSEVGGGMISAENLMRKTPEALEEAAKKMTGAERSAATRGVQRGVKDAVRRDNLFGMHPTGRRAVFSAGDIERSVGGGAPRMERSTLAALLAILQGR